MDETKSQKYSELFMGLVVSFQLGALQHLGKLINPETGKAERHLDAAAASIDMLDMLAEKTRGNLKPEELQTLNETLSLLKLNFVEEANKPAPETVPPPSEPTNAPVGDTPPASKAEPQ